MYLLGNNVLLVVDTFQYSYKMYVSLDRNWKWDNHSIRFFTLILVDSVSLAQLLNIHSVISLHSTLTLQTPPYDGHPDNTGSSKIPGKTKLQLFDSEINSHYYKLSLNEDTNSRTLQCFHAVKGVDYRGLIISKDVWRRSWRVPSNTNTGTRGNTTSSPVTFPTKIRELRESRSFTTHGLFFSLLSSSFFK